MKVAVLTSSRADFGIYYPLVKLLAEDVSINLEIIAFGTHLNKDYGFTIDEIESLNFKVSHKIETNVDNDAPINISNSIGDTILKFSKFWSLHKFDLVFALGDRYEMFAAVCAGSPHTIDFAHIHAGETTLGAIDNMYRHSISLMSKYLFVSTEVYKERAIEINKNPDTVFNVGALSIDNLKEQELFSTEEFYAQFKIDLSKPTILSTFHPETVSLDKNQESIAELINAFKELSQDYQIVITMPNSDTMGSYIREQLKVFGEENNSIFLVESFGMKGYLSCMNFCEFLIGNTSSGFVEAAFFPKWVINLGARQDGRIRTKNIIDSKIKKEAIIESVAILEKRKLPHDTNIYGNGDASKNILIEIKKLYELK